MTIEKCFQEFCRGYGEDFKKTGEAGVTAIGEKTATRHQKPRWKKEREKRILAETKLKKLENIKTRR